MVAVVHHPRPCQRLSQCKHCLDYFISILVFVKWNVLSEVECEADVVVDSKSVIIKESKYWFFLPKYSIIGNKFGS